MLIISIYLLRHLYFFNTIPISKTLLAFLLLILCSFRVSSQNIGIPPIRNFIKNDYGGGIQNWDIKQLESGVLVFANNQGILLYDGEDWDLTPVSNKTIARSVQLKNDKIYVGAQGEFGYFQHNEQQQFIFKNLSVLLPDSLKYFDDVWNIVEVEEKLFFQTSTQVFIYENESINHITAKGIFTKIEKCGAHILLHDTKNGLCIYQEGKLRQIWDTPEHFVLTGMVSLGDSKVLIATLKNGFFEWNGNEVIKWHTSNDMHFLANRIYSLCSLKNNQIAVGTVLGGLALLDKGGRIESILNKENGLQNNNILCLYEDNNNGLWLGLDNGIDYINIDASSRRFYPDNSLEGTGYAALVFNNNLYCGTSNGLYFADWKNYFDPFNDYQFKQVKGTSGQTWNLQEIDKQILLSHHDGAFLIDKSNQPIALENGAGAWTFISLNDTLLLMGGYNGLSLLKKQEEKWVLFKEFQNLKESCRFLVKEKSGTIWVSHPYRGIYKISFDHNYTQLQSKLYNGKNGLPSDLFNHVYEINGKAVFAGETGIYEYAPTADSFLIYQPLNRFFPEGQRIKYLKQDAERNIWFVVEDQVGRITFNTIGVEQQITTKYYPGLSKQLVGGFEFINPISSDHVIFGAEKGFVFFDLNKNNPENDQFNVFLKSITQGGRLVYNSLKIDEGDETMSFPHHQNRFRFSFAAPYFKQQESIEFSSFLEGFDDDWSNWSTIKEREYTNLKPGEYIFRIKAQNGFGQISEAQPLKISIAPPWYANQTAYICYGIFGLALLISIISFQRKYYKKETEELISQIDQQIEQKEQILKKSEAALEAEKNERLRSEIQYKNKELASTTMHLLQKGEILQKIKNELTRLNKDIQHLNTYKREIKSIIRLIQFDTNREEDWNQFAHHFDQVHSNFLIKLKKRYPLLSPNDLKLCAFLRMNLNSKEIANLLNISTRGVEASRYRLRKKLDLQSEKNLTDFMLEL